MSISQTIRSYIFSKVDCLDVEVITSLILDWEHLNRYGWRCKRREIVLSRSIEIEITPLGPPLLKRSDNALGRNDDITVLDRYRTRVSNLNDLLLIYGLWAISMELEHLHVAFLLYHCCLTLLSLQCLVSLTSMLIIRV